METNNSTDFEIAVMNALLFGNDPKLIILRTQFKNSNVKKREFTGVGFFTEFVIPKDIERLDFTTSVQLGDVFAEADGLKEGIGFVLFIEDGILRMLEGFTYDEPWPNKIEKFKLFYLTGHKLEFSSERDMKLLKEKFKE